jgi:hypothetical protein
MTENKVKFENLITSLHSFLGDSCSKHKIFVEFRSGSRPLRRSSNETLECSNHGGACVSCLLEFQYTTHGLLSPTEFCIFCDGCPDALGAGAAHEGGISSLFRNPGFVGSTDPYVLASWIRIR